MKRYFLLFAMLLMAAILLCSCDGGGVGDLKNPFDDQVQDKYPTYSSGLKFFSYKNGTCSVSGMGTCEDEIVVVPPTSPDGDRVVQIGYKAFMGERSKNVKEFILPDGIRVIDDKAFCGVKAKITLGEGIEKIGAYAFSGCTEISEVNLESVRTIDVYAFENCTGLVKVTLSSSLSRICKNAFNGCQSLCVVNVAEGDGELVIEECAFEGCLNLQIVTIPKRVSEIHKGAFRNCRSLDNVDLYPGLKIIGNEAFANCSYIKRISIPEGLSELGGGVFFGCNSLSEVNLPSDLTKIPERMFYNCSAMKSIDLPSGVEYIGSYAFSNCTKLKSIYFSGSEEEFSLIEIGYGNDVITDAEIVFNYLKEN